MEYSILVVVTLVLGCVVCFAGCVVYFIFRDYWTETVSENTRKLLEKKGSVQEELSQLSPFQVQLIGKQWKEILKMAIKDADQKNDTEMQKIRERNVACLQCKASISSKTVVGTFGALGSGTIEVSTEYHCEQCFYKWRSERTERCYAYHESIYNWLRDIHLDIQGKQDHTKKEFSSYYAETLYRFVEKYYKEGLSLDMLQKHFPSVRQVGEN